MNLIITTACNKHCSFCFATDHNQIVKEMSLSDFSELVVRATQEKILFKLLGGEPTMHRNFIEFINKAVSLNAKFSIISNIMYQDPQIHQAIQDAIVNGSCESVLANMSELQGHAYYNFFHANYISLLALERNASGFALRGSLTLNRHKTVQEEVDYVSWLLDTYTIMRLRVSLDFQGSCGEDTYFINNKLYGEKILAISDMCLKYRVPIDWDCKIYPCMFESPEYLHFRVEPFVNRLNYICDDAMPFDVFPDMTYCHCYPANYFQGQNLLSYPSLRHAIREMSFRKKIVKYNENPPEVCQKCDYFLDKRCDSLCFGCRAASNNPLLSMHRGC